MIEIKHTIDGQEIVGKGRTLRDAIVWWADDYAEQSDIPLLGNNRIAMECAESILGLAPDCIDTDIDMLLSRIVALIREAWDAADQQAAYNDLSSSYVDI